MQKWQRSFILPEFQKPGLNFLLRWGQFGSHVQEEFECLDKATCTASPGVNISKHVPLAQTVRRECLSKPR